VSHRASEAELSRYRDRGYFVRESAFGEGELVPLREAVESVHHCVVSEAASVGAAPVERVDDKRYQALLGSTVKWEWRGGGAEIRSMEPYHHLDPRLDSRDLVGRDRRHLIVAGRLGGGDEWLNCRQNRNDCCESTHAVSTKRNLLLFRPSRFFSPF